MKKLRLLFVCTGNTCRSPMAVAILRDLLVRRGHGEVAEIWSAGIAADSGAEATPEARAAMNEVGIELGEHRGHQVSEADLRRADLVFTMTEAHRLRLIDEFNVEGLSSKTHVLGAYLKVYEQGDTGPASPTNKGRGDIVDPYGLGIQEYRKTRNQLRDILESIAPVLLDMTEHVRGESTVTIAIGSDHAGYALKQKVMEYLESNGYTVTDVGTDSTDSVDYPDFAREVAGGVAAGTFERGILICGTGIGMSIAANKVHGVRAALCHDVYSARLTREHNDANVLTMGARVIGEGLATAIVEAWINAGFAGGRHARRVQKIVAMESSPADGL